VERGRRGALGRVRWQTGRMGDGMRIKQIELTGFKSFRDRTVLELPSGVTAIVGPNGCGKSNIVDAIRWVLGEQSPKHLRGAAMEDVIFAGNGEQGPLGLAEVSLLLERSEDDLTQAAEVADDLPVGPESLPPELGRATEIVVTRRYFRSGDSEYSINKVPCRLKDITELFLGTGVGTRAYAIIEQGRVEQIVNAKPAELRLFLEEAAGITRFRARRLAAERKMERTRDNLLRVQDVLHELDRQMGSLQRQARRAEEYQRLKGALRDLDLRIMAARRRRWSRELHEGAADQAHLRGEEERLHAALSASREAGDDARRARHEREARLRATEVELTEHRVAATEAAARIDALAARRSELDARAAQLAADGHAMRAQLAAVAEEQATLEATLDRLSRDQAEAAGERERSQAHLDELGRHGVPLEQAVEEAKDAVVGAVGEEARLRNLAEALHRRRAEIEGHRRQLDDEQRALGARLNENATARDAVRIRIGALEAEGAALEAERQSLLAAARALADEEARQVQDCAAARDRVTQLRSRVESLRELEARYEGCARGVASLLGHDDRALLLAGVLRVPAALERAVAAVLGARLGHVVLPNTARALEAIRWLRETGGGSATVLPHEPERRATVIVPAGRRLVDQIEVDPDYWALAEAVLGNVLLANDLDEAMQVWRDAPHPLTVVTLAGEAVDLLGAVTGGSEPPLEETLLARARELRELGRHVAEAESAQAASQRALEALQTRLHTVNEDARRADERLQTLRLDLVAAEKDRERLEEERGRVAADLEVAALEVSGLAGADGQVAGELTMLDESLAAAAATVVQRREALVRCQEALTGWRGQYAAAEEARTAAAVHATAAAERLRAVEGERTRLQAAARDIMGRAESVERGAAEAREGALAAARETTAAEATRAAAEGRAAALTAEREQLVADVASAEQALAEDDCRQREVSEALEGVRARRGEVDLLLAERRMSLEQLAERLAERYDLGIDVLDGVETEPAEDDPARAEELRARLVRLGDVNPGALAELEEIRGRHEFLDAQRADLERSLHDLRQTIGKLARTSRRRFDETFAAANERLAEVFPKLFPHGLARLQTTEPEEGAEEGVEIVVALPGKKLQSLSLLSGGEKALTATALVFSLFLIRPTPFCLLDEVDAPLDEANIGRFNALVTEMAQRSQFVLITHNRRTMEVAGTLYGITMEQAGVSKVVSVRLSEAA
jgi:chromosome segregation protein